ncbi:unnamed protein product [Acanthoscelides obtectus]|uniref:Hcy-binding domain-containing protein n=1 Tax=Acanthoscelides obtectus TaxID=200917 RepID=A0A9P0LRN2_ACAOB|nr:unnamed protein product [Acanthoscelides obtectus]CAK1651412.1 Homocysteine S-methyltransferase 4 [Acanthoscelides obtectus]
MAPPGIGSSSQPYYPETEQVPNRKITVLDGGFATQLSCHVNDPIDGDVLWSSRFIATNPEAVIKAHLDFLRAGADVIITNTYQSDVDLYAKYLNITRDEAYNLIKKAVELAQIAVKRYQEEFPRNPEDGVAERNVAVSTEIPALLERNIVATSDEFRAPLGKGNVAERDVAISDEILALLGKNNLADQTSTNDLKNELVQSWSKILQEGVSPQVLTTT